MILSNSQISGLSWQEFSKFIQEYFPHAVTFFSHNMPFTKRSELLYYMYENFGSNAWKINGDIETDYLWFIVGSTIFFSSEENKILFTLRWKDKDKLC